VEVRLWRKLVGTRPPWMQAGSCPAVAAKLDALSHRLRADTEKPRRCNGEALGHRPCDRYDTLY